MSANNNITALAQNTRDSVEKAAAASPKINFLIVKPPQPVKLDGEKALPEDSSLVSNSALIPKITTNTSSTSVTGTPPVLSQANSLTESEGDNKDNKKKRKRSRWDQAGSSKIPSIAAKETGHIETVLPGHTPSSSSSSASSPQFSNRSVRSASPQVYTSSDKRQFSNFSDTYKPGMVRVGSKWVYPEDEITDGGTWEHKKRAEEMKKTADQAALLTNQAEAKRAHHIADFLPKEELEKFQSKVKAVKAGGASPEYEDYASNKLDQSNIGFKMLMKQGWQAGEGLGKSSDGIAAPINKAESRPTNAGLGQTKPDGVEEEDDEFEIYRKRMMLAYRFRPNPLNNPRRPYY